MNPVRHPTYAEAQAQCDAFNAAYKLGELIWVYPAERGGRLEEVSIVAPGARVLGRHTAVVQVSGRHGCIALTHVREWGGA